MKRFLGYTVIAIVCFGIGKYISDSYLCGWILSSVSTLVMHVWDDFCGKKNENRDEL